MAGAAWLGPGASVSLDRASLVDRKLRRMAFYVETVLVFKSSAHPHVSRVSLILKSPFLSTVALCKVPKGDGIKGAETAS